MKTILLGWVAGIIYSDGCEWLFNNRMELKDAEEVARTWPSKAEAEKALAEWRRNNPKCRHEGLVRKYFLEVY